MADLDRDGFALIAGVLSAAQVEDARIACATALAQEANADSVLAGRSGPAYGARNLLQLWPACVDLLRLEPLATILKNVLGASAGVVRGLYFDKPPGHSWALPWHRDLTIAVKQPGHLGVFRKPTHKAGVPHVEASQDLLAAMLTVRIHLDEMTPANGPLRVVPGSHERGPKQAAVTVTSAAGDVLLMRPLVLHASGHCAPDYAGHRRIVHLECAPQRDLPDGYEWHDFLPLVR